MPKKLFAEKLVLSFIFYLFFIYFLFIFYLFFIYFFNNNNIIKIIINIIINIIIQIIPIPDTKLIISFF